MKKHLPNTLFCIFIFFFLAFVEETVLIRTSVQLIYRYVYAYLYVYNDYVQMK